MKFWQYTLFWGGHGCVYRKIMATHRIVAEISQSAPKWQRNRSSSVEPEFHFISEKVTSNQGGDALRQQFLKHVVGDTINRWGKLIIIVNVHADNYAYLHLSTLHFTSYCTCGVHSPEHLTTLVEFFKWSHRILKSCLYELCLLICFPEIEWWTEWRCRAAALRAAKWGRIPGTQWHLLHCKTLLLLSFMELDLLFSEDIKRGIEGLTTSRGERRKKMREITTHKAILVKITRNDLPEHAKGFNFIPPVLEETALMQFFTQCFYFFPLYPSIWHRWQQQLPQ